jgi:hypothetical protein
MARLLFNISLIACFLSSPAFAGENGQMCAERRPTPLAINLELELPDAVYNLHESLSDINRDNSGLDDWITRNGMQKVWKSKEMSKLGYAEGGTAVMSSLYMMARHYDQYGVYYCTYIASVDVAMMMRTRIVIPNNFKKGGCRFNLIHEHEYRHYQTNRAVADEFVKRLYKDLPVIIADIEGRQPYVQKSEVPKAYERLKTSVASAIELYIVESMRAELTRRNDLIDTPAEYASSGPKMKACKD